MKFLTALIALMALYIAYQQWQTNAIRLRHELYDRRLKVYKDIRRLISDAPEADYETVMKVFDSNTESHFLFGPEIPTYIGVLWEKTNRLAVINAERSAGNDFHGMEDERIALVVWFHEQYEEAKEKFRPYLQIQHRPLWERIRRRSRNDEAT